MENFTAERQNDSALHVQFYTDAIKHGVESEAAGRPVFVDIDMVRIIIPGDNKTVIETKVDETHKFRFPEHWKRYSQGKTQEVKGWPLKEWPQLTASQVKELNYHEVHTVEQLANISDHAVNALGMGMHDLRAKAKAALSNAAGNANIEAAAVREQNLLNELESMKAQIAQINKDALESGKRGPGRPAKESA